MSASHPVQSLRSGRECWLPTLQLAIQEVFDLMLGCPLEVAPEISSNEGLEITAMVGLAGRVRGVLSLRCSAKSAARMASRMLGIEGDETSAETWDAVGEVCNMVAGNFKNKISGLGDGCMLSVPTVIEGGGYSLHALAGDEFRTAMLFEGFPILLSLEVHE
jgi:chemotaxis protein CheX